MRSRRRAGLLAELAAWAAFVWAFGLLLRAHLFFLSPPTVLHGLDEGYVNAFAWRMIDGQMLPFVDAVSHRGPLMYWLVALAMKLGSPTSWVPIRVVSLLCGTFTVAFTFLAGWRSGRTLAGAVGALAVVVAYLLGMGPIDGLAYSGEHLSNVFGMGALLALVAALDRDRRAPSVALVGAAGALVAMGALAKQVGAVAIAPLGLWVLAAALSRPGLARCARWALVGAFAAGVALPVLVTAARYAAAGELRTLVYYTFTYNSEVYLGPYTTEAKLEVMRGWTANHGILLGILLPIALWAAARPLAAAARLRDLPRTYDEQGFVATVGLGALAVSFSSNAALRDFIHYYIQVVPWCGLLLGAVVERAFEERRPLGAFRGALVRALPLVAMMALLHVGTGSRFEHYAKDRKANRAFGDLRASPICDYIRSASRPGDSLFVWGFLPELYTSCERKPASRYVFTTFVAGYVPWFDKASKAEDDARAVPRSREILIADLERSRPPILIDAPRTMGNRGMRRYEALAAYLDRRYCAAPERAGFGVFLRKTDDGACPAGAGAPRAR